MNLRIEGNALRFRLSGDEFTRLQMEGELLQTTPLAAGLVMIYAVRLLEPGNNARTLALSATPRDSGLDICLDVSHAGYADLASRLGGKEGLFDWCDTGNGSPLEITLDVDVRSAAKH